jgi:hypothetical protein
VIGYVNGNQEVRCKFKNGEGQVVEDNFKEEDLISL